MFRGMDYDTYLEYGASEASCVDPENEDKENERQKHWEIPEERYYED